jgi:ligand-binding sensor domain-containing protein
MNNLRFVVVLSLLSVLLGGYADAQWVQTNKLPGGFITALVAEPNGTGATNLFAGTNSGVYLSTNNGTSWSAPGTGLPSDTRVNAIALEGTNLFAGTDSGVYLSTDNGTSWTLASAGLPANTSVSALAVIGTNLFAGTSSEYSWSERGVFLSTNNGTSWTGVNTGLMNSTVSAFAVNGPNLFVETNSGVYLSTNNGTSWTVASAGLPANTNVGALAFIGTNLFASTGGGVFLSTDNGGNWIAVNQLDRLQHPWPASCGASERGTRGRLPRSSL